MAKKEASDLHLKPMRPPLLRIKGRLIPLNADALQPKDLEEMLLSILTPAQGSGWIGISPSTSAMA